MYGDIIGYALKAMFLCGVLAAGIAFVAGYALYRILF